MKTFSQRFGHAPVQEKIQVDTMSADLRASLWNVLQNSVWDSEGFMFAPRGTTSGIDRFSRALWTNYFKKPVDSRPRSTYGLHGGETLKLIRSHFFGGEWHEVYSFIEFVVNYYESTKPRLKLLLDKVLEREMSGYRFLENELIPVTDELEVAALNEALAETRFGGVDKHLSRSLELLADRTNPDYRNSIKESISAVEGMARHVTGKSTATLGDALKTLEKSGKLHPSLSAGFNKLYGYTSDASGIRHAMQDEPNLTQADAKYFLLSCTSFVNYLKASLP